VQSAEEQQERKEGSGCDSDEANAADDVVRWRVAGFDGHDFDGIGVVVRTKEEIAIGNFYVTDGAASIGLTHRVHVVLLFAIAPQGVVMAIDQGCRAGQQTGKHAHGFASVSQNGDKTVPTLPIAFGRRAKATKEAGAKFQNVLDHHVHDQGLRGGDARVSEHDILESIVFAGNHTGALIDFMGIEQVRLYGQVRDQLDCRSGSAETNAYEDCPEAF
jgi:hypothetical protein